MGIEIILVPSLHIMSVLGHPLEYVRVLAQPAAMVSTAL